MERNRERMALAGALFLQSFALLLYELLLTRLFAITLFADFAHLALALAMLGIGVGAIAQHLRPSLVPDKGLLQRIGWLGMLQAGFTLLAVLAAIRFPVLRELEVPPVTYQDRSSLKDDLLDPVWFAALLPVLALPFATAGLSFAGAFQRRKNDIGWLYGADLVGAAISAVVFVPLLGVFAGPDTVFVVLAAAASSSVLAFVVAEDRRNAGAAVLALIASLALVGVSTRGDLLPIRTAAGYAEHQLVYTRWTPLTRLAIHRDDERGDYMVLDNSSASEIVRTEKQRNHVARAANRALVYHLHEPEGARVAILAASAGPEVAAAQSRGFETIDAIDIASEIFDIVAERYADAPVNPYRSEGVQRVHADGRAAILRATEPYDVIQMVHANLWSSAGMMSNAWSPALLETQEAFETYLDHLTDDGTLSFGKGSQTDQILRAAVAALEARGVTEPWRHVAFLKGNQTTLLVKKQPWTEADHDRLLLSLKTFRDVKIVLDPMEPKPSRLWTEMLERGPVMTDDHPYGDSPAVFGETVQRAMKKAKGETDEPLAALYRSFVLQCGFVLVAGLLFVGVPVAWRGRSEMRGLSGAGAGLVYVAGLGYGYLSVETVLIHSLVLFVGHPTYAITMVVLTMLLFSGLGAVWAERPSRETLAWTLRVMLVAVLGLGLLVSFVITPLLYQHALQLPLGGRLVISAVVLAPLAFVMGTAFPLGVRLLPDRAAPLLPWAWAMNAWTSVVGSLATVMVARLWGYSVAFAVALCAYAIAALVAPRLARIGGDEAEAPKDAEPEAEPQAAAG